MKRLWSLVVSLSVAGVSVTGCGESEVEPTSPPNSPVPQAKQSIPNNERSQAVSDLPQPNAKGDYITKSYHQQWQAIDSDPDGLNCRMGDRPVAEIWDPGTGALEIGSWSVVGTLEQNQTFTAGLTPAGFVVTFDADNQPWIYVESSEAGAPSNCFVRANSQYVQPIPTEN